MPLSKLQFRPGVNRDTTTYAGEGGWYACDKIRFRSGFPEKLGGWVRLSSSTFLGICRSLFNWVTLANANLLTVGTNLKYYIFGAGAFNDITPLRDFSLTGTYAQVASTTITVTITDHLVQTGNEVTLHFTSGDAISGDYTATKTGANTFTVQGPSDTTSGNVTLYRRSTLLTNPFTTTNGSAVVTVTHTSHGALNNDYVTFSGASGFNNIPAGELNAQHQITWVSGNSYTITVTTAANASSSGGGTVTAQYQINTGLNSYVQGLGWGAGPWNDAGTAWGQSAALGPGGQLRLWTQDNYGENLLFAPRGGTIYYWDAPSGAYTFTNRGVYLQDAAFAAGYQGQFVPSTTNQILASPTTRIMIALGANPYNPASATTAFDPMLVRWCDQENVFNWVPEATNQAGEQRLILGSYIVAGVATKQETLIWTDAALYSMQYVPQYVFGFTLLGIQHGLMSPNAHASANGEVYWMGKDKFYMYNGRVDELPTTLWQYVFDDFNYDQAFKVVAGTNTGFTEVWWHYPSADSAENDRYVIYNYGEKLWYYGTLERTAWLDSPLLSSPIAATDAGTLLYHENGIDDNATGTPVAIDAYIQSNDFDIGDGNNFAFVWRVIPDINFTGSSNGVQPAATMALYPRQAPGANYGTAASATATGAVYPLTAYTQYLMTRVRGRALSLRVSSSGVGTQWQLGTPRLDVRPDGRKS